VNELTYVDGIDQCDELLDLVDCLQMAVDSPDRNVLRNQHLALFGVVKDKIENMQNLFKNIGTK